VISGFTSTELVERAVCLEPLNKFLSASDDMGIKLRIKF
jgi:hypothetical protein